MIDERGRSAVVVDASVALKWFLPEPGTDVALRLRDDAARGRITLHAPEHWLAEMANVLWLRSRRDARLPASDATLLVRELPAVPVRRHGPGPVLGEAFEISSAAGITLYDSLYVATARALGARFVTADRRLVTRLAETRWRNLAVELAE